MKKDSGGAPPSPEHRLELSIKEWLHYIKPGQVGCFILSFLKVVMSERMVSRVLSGVSICKINYLFKSALAVIE